MIGYFGGSFDPVHFGHLRQARAIKQELSLSQLFLMPCNAPKHRSNLFFSNQQRLEMLHLALQEFDDLSISTEEINNPASSYTIDTLKRLKTQRPNQQLCLIMGADSFEELPTWKHYQQLPDYAQLVVLPRDGSIKSDKNVYFAKTPLIDISSTQIRNILSQQPQQGKIDNLSGLLPDAVIQYIAQLWT